MRNHCRYSKELHCKNDHIQYIDTTTNVYTVIVCVCFCHKNVLYYSVEDLQTHTNYSGGYQAEHPTIIGQQLPHKNTLQTYSSVVHQVKCWKVLQSYS